MFRTRMSTFLLISLFFILAGCGNTPPKTEPASTVSLVWPSPPEKPRIEYLYSVSGPEDIGVKRSFVQKVWSVITGNDDAQRLVRPYGACSGPDGMLCVADPGTRSVHIFHAKEGSYRQIQKAGKEYLNSPIGIAMDGTGLLYVSDSVLKKIFVYDKNDKLVAEIGGGDRFARPTGLAIDTNLKRLYVTDTLNHSVMVMDLKGNLITQLGKLGDEDGDFNYPTAVTTDGNGNIYVNDSMNFRIQVFDSNGRFISKFGKHGDGMGEFSNPKGVGIDTEGHIYVADAIFDSIQIFSDKGELLLFFGQAGHEPGEFWIPTSVFIDPSNKIFVCDSYTQRVQVFRFLGGE